MQLISEKNYRLAISFIFLLLVLLPMLFISSSLQQINDESHSQRLLFAEQGLKDEVQAFQDDLVARLRIEKLIKHAERRVGLAAATAEKPRFIKGVDPQVFTATTVPDLLRAYKELAGVEPSMMVAFGADVRNIWKWFASELGDISSEDRRRIGSILSVLVADLKDFKLVVTSDKNAVDNYYQVGRHALGEFSGMTQAYYSVFTRLISDMAYPLPYQGACYETATNKMGSRKLFSYSRNLKDGEKIYGGYFVMFASRVFPPQKLLADAINLCHQGFSRKYLLKESGESDKIVSNKKCIQMKTRVPAELVGYNSLFEKPATLPAGLLVSFSTDQINLEWVAFSQQLLLAQRVLLLLCMTVMVYFILFGFPTIFRLRARMWLSISIAVLLPYAILGQVSSRLLDRIESLGRYELKSEAESQMFRLHSYYEDQRQQNLLQTMKLKTRLIRICDLPETELRQLDAYQIVPASSSVVLTLVRNDGVARAFSARNPADKTFNNLDRVFSVKFLDNMGMLDRDSPEVKKLLNMTTLADGFLDTIRQEYLEHNILVNEACETLELTKVDDFSRMIYFLVPSPGDPAGNIRAMAFTSVSNLDNVIYGSNEFDSQLFSSSANLSRHDFIMGQRRAEDTMERWWPGSVSHDSELKGLLDSTVRSRSSSSQLVGDNGAYRFFNRRFNTSETMVYAGISSIAPDLLLRLLIKVFPFLLLVFALASVMLFADILAALFISPVKGFSRGAAAVAEGNYQQRLEIERTDEFSLLADAFNRMTEGLAQREKMRRFVSENLYEKLGMQTGLNELKSVQVSRVTMLAADIRSFTSLSEKHDPQIIVSLLNDYFTAMETAINSHNGFIERFIGDAVMAVFYSGDGVSAEERAAQAAISMRAQLASLNRTRVAQGLFTIENGIGIATGAAASGMVGNEGGRMVFAVIGEVVTLAERLESHTRNVSSKILVCAETAAKLGSGFVIKDASAEAGVRAFELLIPATGDNHG